MWGRITAATSTTLSITLPSLRSSSQLPLTLSTNRLARLTPSSAVLTAGDQTTLLATLTHNLQPSTTPTSFKPFLVDFRAKAAALGIIPGTWTRREAQPVASEILTARLIDRSLRPVLPSQFPSSQLTVSVFSAARNKDAPSIDVLAVNAAAAAIATADKPQMPLVAASRVALVNDQFILFPSEMDLDQADLSVFVAVNEMNRIVAMAVEAGKEDVKEQIVMDGVGEAVEAAVPILDVQKKFRELVWEQREKEGRSAFPRVMPSRKIEMVQVSQEERDMIFEMAQKVYSEAFVKCREFPGKAHRAKIVTEAQQTILDAFPKVEMTVVLEEANKASKKAFRNVLLKDRKRIDGRSLDEIRPIRCEAGILPGDVHGSAIFERGDTQVLACSTIGLKKKAVRTEEYVDGSGEKKNFFVHYSFPPYSTGDTGRFAGLQSRREIGHGALAERAIEPVLNFSKENDDDNSEYSYPYALRLSAEVLGSDGSSSMATVCAGSMALAQSGAPLQKLVAGVAMGLISTEDDLQEDVILTDILGAEDHFGEMDMKVTGTDSSITACQLDMKRRDGLSLEIIQKSFEKAKIARLKILKEMKQSMEMEEYEMPEHAPRVIEMGVNTILALRILMKDRAEGLRQIEEKSEANLTFNGRDGTILIEAPNKQSMECARNMIIEALGDLEIGTTMMAKVIEVKPSFAILEGASGIAQGILHVSKMNVSKEGFEKENGSWKYTDARKIIKVGQEIEVVVIECDKSRNIIRFGLKNTTDKKDSLQDRIASFLEATRV